MDMPACVRGIQDTGAVGRIPGTVAMIAGLDFVAVIHVTGHSWTTCAVLDKLGFGLTVGDGLDVATALCGEVRATAGSIVIDSVDESARYRGHPTPRIHGGRDTRWPPSVFPCRSAAAARRRR